MRNEIARWEITGQLVLRLLLVRGKVVIAASDPSYAPNKLLSARGLFNKLPHFEHRRIATGEA